MTDQLYVSYGVFRADAERTREIERDVAAKEVRSVLEDHEDTVSTRGIYTTGAFTARADLMFWWISPSVDALQDITAEVRRTELGRTLVPEVSFLGVTRPAEFAKDHLPAFAKGEPPKKYICVYPFVRTPDWYLLAPEKRAGLLKEHGEAGREYPDVLANTTSAFGLGDWEWILCFEADSPVRTVELIRRLRTTEARRFTKVEVPFVSGIRRSVEEAVQALP